MVLLLGQLGALCELGEYLVVVGFELQRFPETDCSLKIIFKSDVGLSFPDYSFDMAGVDFLGHLAVLQRLCVVLKCEVCRSPIAIQDVLSNSTGYIGRVHFDCFGVVIYGLFVLLVGIQGVSDVLELG